MADQVVVYAAGSLEAAFRAMSERFQSATGNAVSCTFGASGLLRWRIENGETAHVFASADTAHPGVLLQAGLSGPVSVFARNSLCALAGLGMDVTPQTLLDVLLMPDIRIGTSTPGADPSGDYAWVLFEKAESLKPGAFAQLDAKALRLSGGPDSEEAPAGRNLYGWLMEQGRADIFLTYRTNALLAADDAPVVRVVEVPDALGVSAAYGLTVLDGAPAPARAFADFVMSEAGQGILADHGFETG